jgi:hypothetical protein
MEAQGAVSEASMAQKGSHIHRDLYQSAARMVAERIFRDLVMKDGLVEQMMST